jgi:hypothetical protein
MQGANCGDRGPIMRKGTLSAAVPHLESWGKQSMPMPHGMPHFGGSPTHHLGGGGLRGVSVHAGPA